MIRIGQGWDIHKLVEGRPLILGGVTIPHDKGLLGHSDADALLHAITGAAGLLLGIQLGLLRLQLLDELGGVGFVVGTAKKRHGAVREPLGNRAF